MKKTLRYFMLLFMTAMVSFTYAEEVTFDFLSAESIEALGFTAPSAGAGTEIGTSPIVSGAVTINTTDGTTPTRFWQASGANEGKYDLRIYTDGTMKFSVPEGRTITQITFTKSKSSASPKWADPKVDTGTIAGLVWTGSASAVTFTLTGQCQIGTIVVTLDGEVAPAVLTIEGEDNFTDKTTVTITGTVDDGQVFYTLDGTTPSMDANLYTAPFEITETTTVKAIEYDADDEQIGEIVEKTFTKKEIEYVEAATIAEFNALAANTENVRLTLKDAVVLGVGNNNIVINDGTAGTDIFKLGVTVKQGSVLNGTIVGKRVDYNGITEMSNVTANTLEVTDGTVPAATAVTVAEALAAENFAGLVKMEKATIGIKAANNRYYAVNGTDSIQVYDNFKLGFTLAEGEYYVEGVIGAFKEKQIWLTKFESDAPVETVEVANIAEFLDLAEGTEAKLTLTDAKVLYSWTSNNGNNSTYVRDATGAICFNRTALGLETNEDVNGFVYVLRSSYNKLPQANVSAANETNAENLTHEAGDPAEAKVIAVTEAADYLNDLVSLNDVAVTVDGTKYYATVGEDKVQIYNGFHLDDFNDLSAFVSEEQNYNVKGIMVVYNTTYEIYPIEITPAEQGNPYDLNNDGKVSTADIQVIINEMKKGEAEQNTDYDLNGDGKISTADIQVIINEMKK